MTTEKAKEIFEEIVEICYETENQKLIETANYIIRDVENVTDLSQIINLAEDLQIHINEMDIIPEEEEQIQDMNEMIEKLSE